MLAYTPQDAFTDSDIYDLSDLVKGGLVGASNLPIKALLDRSEYLLNRLASFEAIKLLTGSYSYDVADLRKQFVFNLTDNCTFTLPDVTSIRSGSLIPIHTQINTIKALTIQCYGTQNIKSGGIFGQDVAAMFMHNAESLVLEAAGDHWIVFSESGNFYMGIGETFQGRIIGKNMILAQGQIVNRADVPRLSEFLSLLTYGQQVIDDITWLSDPGGIPIYRGCFSYGNGTSTLRIPDERGLFVRNLDLGRGIDTDRWQDYPGVLELDAIGPHTHPTKRTRTDTVGTRYEGNTLRQGGDRGLWTGDDLNTGINSTGSETRPKNIGKLALIRF